MKKKFTSMAPSKAIQLTVDNFPKHMIHLRGLMLISVNTFQKQTPIHIRLYAKNGSCILHPTKSEVSMKLEVCSAFHSQLCCFRPNENFKSAFIVTKDVCLLNLSDIDSKCLSIRRLFQRKDSSFQFVLERVLLHGENLSKLLDSYELVFECGKQKLLTYTLCEYVLLELDHLPENEHFFLN
ncbi:PC4 domain-containing protein [Nephila pilipes]|uniref:PC4 domain-containing protein n=1 Tax=Nephila pilipes TaxID=299642 RepID=A0A8X6TL28_NEPPI|nr:PC4 domain-containing protein [Nephila pilipes]